jgi:replicative DNA helicase Mcm
MAQAPQNDELTERFIQFYRNYYRDAIGKLAQRFPNEQRSLHVDYDDLSTFDHDLADDYLARPDEFQRYAEEALRLYDLPADVSLGQAHVRLTNIPDTIDIRNIRVHDDHIGKLVSVQGIVRKATDVRPKITEAAFECQRCGTMTYIPQQDSGFQEPHECQGCERQGPFRVNFDQSEFVDSQKIRVQESPEGLRGGETPQSIDVNLEDDITGRVTAGDHVTLNGVLHIEQQTSNNEKTPIFDLYMDGVSITIEDEEFEDMEITEEDVLEILELSNSPDIYEKMVGSLAPSIYGYEQEKLAMILQLFSGVTKRLKDGSRIRGDLHMLLIGDPGTGKCVSGDTRVTLADGRDVAIGELVESHLDEPKPVDDGVWDHADFDVPSLQQDGTIAPRRATKVWKREAPERMYHIRTASGRELTVTPSHPLFVQDGGRFVPVVAAELSEGAFVATPRHISTRSVDDLDVDFRRSVSPNAVRLDLPDEWTPWLARLVGYVVAEGYVEQRDDNTGYVSVTNNDPEVLDDVAEAYDRLGLNHFVWEPHPGKAARELVCASGEFVSFLHAVEPALLEQSSEQVVPDAISRASRRIRTAFVRALIEGEGHVSTSQREIAVASTSRDLLEEVRTLLLSLGICTQLHPRRNGSYRLRISGEDVTRYVERIGFVSNRKREAVAAFQRAGTNTNRDVIPGLATALRRVREGLGMTQSDFELPRSTYQHYERGDRNPSRTNLRRVTTEFEQRLGSGSHSSMGTPVLADGGTLAPTLERDVRRFRALTDGDVTWDRIESIETVAPDEEWVYDLEVDQTHNYLTNGVLSHNSQLLSYVRNIAPRSVYTSGKGSSSAGLTAAAVRDDFGDGQQWTLEAGALVLADKGIAAVDELDKMRCVAGDTLVHLADGRIQRIGDLARTAAESGTVETLDNGRTIRNFDADLSVWTMTEDGRLVERSVSAVHEYDAPDELAEVQLQSGERLASTHDHPYFVFEEGERVVRAASELSEGDWVYVPRALPRPASDGGVVSPAAADPPVVDTTPGERALGAVLGYLSGDGNIYYDREAGSYGIRFTNREEELLADFERACRTAFGGEPTRPPSERRGDGVATVRLPGREYADQVLDAGMNLETYDDKAFPVGVTEFDRESKAAFVRALADSEGSVDISSRNVKIHSASRDLLLGTKSLLTEFGVSSQIQTRTRDDGLDLFVLAITAADSLDAFARRIGFTLSRKQEALSAVTDAVSGDRTILDVIPECSDHLAQCRRSLRLHQSECGLASGTYHSFENGHANVSLRLARRVLAAFEERQAQARHDLDRLDSGPGWETLTELKHRYHASQRELAIDSRFSQQQVSRHWGEREALRATVTDRLRDLLDSVVDTDLSTFRDLVAGNVKWRRVSNVTDISSDHVDDRIPVLLTKLADVLGCSSDVAVERGRELLANEPSASSWRELRGELARHGVSHAAVAEELGVDGSTVSRWLGEHVAVDRFAEARLAGLDLVRETRTDVRRLLDRIVERQRTKVYDLTVEGTHNFVANGMIVHNSEDRSAMHEALEQQTISVSKAGINATLKSRCSLLGAANPKYGRFDQFESIGEQIDLEPALISRFDLIFTITDQPDPEKDADLADHILQTNYAGELHTHRTHMTNPDFSQEQVDAASEDVEPVIDAELLRKYIAHARRNCFPTMTDEARAAIRDFYVDLRARGSEDGDPVPVTARKLEALVRLAEASARVRHSDTVEAEDAERVIGIVRSCLEAIGVDPETGEFDADIIETGRSKTQRDRIKNLKGLISELESEYEDGAPIDEVLDQAEMELDLDRSKAESEIEKLRRKGEVYEPRQGHLRTTG